MTTMSDSGTSFAGLPGDRPRMLRRSGTDRVISGVSGGLGQYFGVDPVIFRVLFAVLSFFGGVGLLAYGVAWLLIPEPDVDRSALDRALNELRVHRVPPWLVVVGGAVVVWLGWFSWWAPHTLPALLLLAAVALVLLRRLRDRPAGAVPPAATAAGVTEQGAPLWPHAESTATENTEPPAAENTAAEPPAAGSTAVLPAAGGSAVPAGPFENTAILPDETGTEQHPHWPPPPVGPPLAARAEPLIPPLNDTRRSMQAWLAEAGEAHRTRVRRRRPIKIAVGLALLVGWGVVGMLDGFTRVPFPAYLWVGLAILTAGLLVSIVTRRMVLSLLVPILVLVAAVIAVGGTRASLSDGSGRIGWRPTSQSQLTTYRQFAGQSTLDLTGLGSLSSPASVQVTQAAGEVVLRVPNSLNATVIADVHLGDIAQGTSRSAGQYQAGGNVHLQLDPPAGATGQPLTVHVSLTAGHVEVDRVG
ncbi:MAG TPA: PspC domain-containing protein [Jatrophihabitans sp.]|nr:PspC domain-containing protein [Jatrophihabitans sp.]